MEFVVSKKAVNEAGECDKSYIAERAEALRRCYLEPVFKALDLGKVYAFLETEIRCTRSS